MTKNQKKTASQSSRKTSLVRQVWIGMLMACLFPIIVLSYQSYHCSRQAVIQLQENALNAVAHLKERQIQNWLDERRRDLRSLVKSECMEGCTCAPGGHGCRLFGVVSAREATYEALYLYDSKWTLLQKHTEHDVLEADLLTDAQKSKIAGSDDLVFFSAHSHSDGSVSIHGGCRLTDMSGLKGYAFAMMHATDAIEVVLEKRNRSYRLRILDTDGYDVMNPGTGRINNTLPVKLLTGTEQLQSYRTTDQGESMVGVSKSIPALRWTLIVEADELSTFKWLTILRNRSITTAILAFIAAMVIAGILTRSITAPFKLLAATARKVSSGNIRLRADPGTARESSEVAAAFNEMLDSLEFLRKDLSQQTALAAIGQLSSSVVHEMRNPLSSIRLNIQALAKKVEGDPVHLELAEIAREQTDRLEHLLSELLMYGKPVVLEKSAVSFRKLSRWIERDATPIIEDREITLHIRTPDQPIHLEIDLQRMRQVFSNLIENAVQACDDNGTVEIAIGTIDGELNITVTDNGPGIPEIDLPELFQPFVTGRSDGTGLGLANVKKIVELHGGTVGAANRPVGGAEFTVTLPLFREERP